VLPATMLEGGIAVAGAQATCDAQRFASERSGGDGFNPRRGGGVDPRDILSRASIDSDLESSEHARAGSDSQRDQA
jgi:hypothetical protein